MAHRHGIPLVVDAAWGAHLGFHPALPPHALAAGADALVTSAHKALPAWSQGALVLARSRRIGRARFDAAVEATATTSPSGAILASIDAARALLQRDGEALIGPVIEAVATVRERLARVPGLVVLDGPGVDPMRLTLVLPGTGADGNAVESDLLARGMPVEMADRDTVVAMVTLADTPEGLVDLAIALVESVDRHRGSPRPVVTSGVWAVDPVTVTSPAGGLLRPSRERHDRAGRGSGQCRARRAVPAGHPGARAGRGGHPRGGRGAAGGPGCREPDRLCRGPDACTPSTSSPSSRAAESRARRAAAGSRPRATYRRF